MHVPDIGMVIMQCCRPGNHGFEPLLKAFHHRSGQFVHIEIAFYILKHRVGAEFEAVEIRAFGRISDKLVGLLSAHSSRWTKKRSGEALFLLAGPRLDVGNIRFGNGALPSRPFAIIGSDNGHCPLRLPPLLLLINHPAFDFPNEFLKFRGPTNELLLGLLERVVEDVV